MLDAHIDQLLYQGTSQTKSQSKDDSGSTKLVLRSPSGRHITSGLASLYNELSCLYTEEQNWSGIRDGRSLTDKNLNIYNPRPIRGMSYTVLYLSTILRRKLLLLKISLVQLELESTSIPVASSEQNLVVIKRTHLQGTTELAHGLTQILRGYEEQHIFAKLSVWLQAFEISHLK